MFGIICNIDWAVAADPRPTYHITANVISAYVHYTLYKMCVDIPSTVEPLKTLSWKSNVLEKQK